MAMLPSPLIPDASQWIAARQAGYEHGDAMRRRNVLLEAGQLAAAGGGQQPVQPMAQPSQRAGGGMPAYSGAISSIESGGRYDAIGPTTRTGDRAYGKYQVMGANIPSWTKKHLGREMTPQQFLADKDAQEKVFNGEFGGYVAKYGNPQDAASMWFTGKPAAQGAGRSDGYTTQPEYLRRFNSALGAGGAPAPTAQASAPAPVSDPNAGLRNASNALLRGGELQAGLGIQNQLYERSEKARAEASAKEKEMQGIIGELALRADTPEKWARAVEVARRNGLKVDGLEDFSARELVLARAGKSMNYMAAGKRVFNETTGQYVPLDPNAPADEDDELGLVPVTGTDEKGNPILYQLSKSGKPPKRVEFAPGFTPTKPLDFRDVGTGYQGINRITNQQQTFIPKDVAGAAAQKEIGESRGQAQVDLPRQTDNANAALQTIEAIRAHPGRGFGTGSTGVLPGVPGTQQKDFIALVDQAKGKAFLEAFNSLKGGGAITEVEGKKATDAIARLDRTQSESGFLKALDDLEAVIRTGLDRAQKKAGGGGDAAPADAPKQRLRFNPETGELE